uniref:Cyclopropane fatty-acyl-phospholipid synthase n=1 Tax=Candidatus Kentrum sp. LPFa TaxID=2126335 RepID=A0A450W948_9GAMM|nr:MAG: Cyclopropane fatty-acyl-phospholipid synthase [Candidatus Kentron sp. LPFa]
MDNPAPPHDLDRFYSREPVHAWKQIIGRDLHYHFGYFFGAEELETGLRQTVRNYYPYIEPGSRVLDVGCGWGGPAKMLREERDCRVVGVTSSQTQVEYCRHLGMEAWRRDLDGETNPLPNVSSGGVDIIFSLEMISHIRHKLRLLRRLRESGARLILSESCVADGYSGERTVFGGSILLCSVSELAHDVEAAGWEIRWMRDRRFHSLRTLSLWKQNLDRIYGEREPPGQLGVLRDLVDAALPSPVEWCRSFPLIDIVAE